MWWFASATFAVLIVITLLQRIPEGSHEVNLLHNFIELISEYFV